MEVTIQEGNGECAHYAEAPDHDRFVIKHSFLEEARDCHAEYYCCGSCKTVLIAKFYQWYTNYLNGEDAVIVTCPYGHRFLSFAQFYEPSKE
jgi:hypothetical protein